VGRQDGDAKFGATCTHCEFQVAPRRGDVLLGTTLDPKLRTVDPAS